MGNKKKKIQKNWQHMVHKTKKNKPKHKTICVRYHYSQTNTNLGKRDRILILSNKLANKHCNVFLMYLTVNMYVA